MTTSLISRTIGISCTSLPRGTDQTGTNRQALLDAEEVHMYWNPASKGSGFDLGMYFAAEKLMSGKKFVLINKTNVQPTPHKSFENVMLELHKRHECS